MLKHKYTDNVTDSDFNSLFCGSELFGCLIAASWEIGKMIKTCKAKDYVIGMEITTLLKTFFASPLIK